MRVCSIEGCGKTHKSRGLCNTHYERLRLTGTTDSRAPTPEGRFSTHVDKQGSNGCWLWTGTKNNKGYGTVTVKRRIQYAHRFAYETANGPIPESLVIDHVCHVPACVNPSHLRAVTVKQNVENHSGPRSDNRSSGRRNVYWHKTARLWYVVVHDRGISHSGGCYRDVEEANKAAIALRNRLFTHNDIDRIAS